MKKSLFLLSVLLLFILLWEYAGWRLESFTFVVPRPSGIVARMYDVPGRFLIHSYATFLEMIGGLALATALSFVMAWIMIEFSSAATVLQPLFLTIKCIPMFTLAPLMVLWFGWGYTAILIPTTLMIFFPVTLNIYQGLKSVPQEWLDYFALHHATSWQTFIKLRLPWARPSIFTGIKLGTAAAGIGAIAGEWAGAQEGLGILMIESRRAIDLETTFAALVCLTILSLSFYGAACALEKYFTESVRN
ncbi:MAG: hypothetical protein CMO81_03160 [Waddliaceae bacterium]|nr:hypothetical protein [Waddliaceae bacterium]